MTWVVVLITILVSFMFAGVEAGILSVNRVRLRHRVKMRDRAAIKLDRLLAHPERLLATVLLVTNFMNICAVILITQEMVDWLGSAGYAATFAVVLPFYLFLFELLPKSLFRRFPYRALAALAEPLRLAYAAVSPLLAFGSWLADVLVLRKGSETRDIFAAREEFKYVTIESERTGALSRMEREMIHNVVDFRAVTARDVMVPREAVTAVPVGSSIEDLLRIYRDHRMERLPVTTDAGQVAGIVNVFELLVEGRQTGVAGDQMRRIVTVRENEPALTVMAKLRAARLNLASVVDENGRMVGIATSEDLVRRLVTPPVVSA